MGKQRFSKVDGHHVYLMDKATKSLKCPPNRIIVQSLETGNTYEIDKRYLGRITKTSDYFTKENSAKNVLFKKR